MHRHRLSQQDNGQDSGAGERNDWFKRKFDWVERIAEDPSLRGLPLAIAVKFGWRYLNADKKYAWVGVDTLAQQLGVTPRSVQRALDQLIAAGVLAVQQGGRGPRDTNHYFMRDGFKGDVDVALSGNKGDIRVRKRVTSASAKGDVDVTQILREREAEGKGESARARDPSVFPGGKAGDAAQPNKPTTAKPKQPAGANPAATGGRRAAPATSAGKPIAESFVRKQMRPAQTNGTGFPEDWVCGTTEEEVAADLAGWDADKAVWEFGKFRDYHVGAGSQRADWEAVWRKWCRDGLDFDQRSPRQASGQRPTGLASVLIGLNKVLQQTDDD